MLIKKHQMSKNIWENYIKDKILGSNPFSIVYKAKNKNTGNYVAIKEIDLQKYKELTKSNFKKEEIIKRLKSKNRMILRETIESNGFFYIIMELYLSNLEDYLKSREENLSIEEIREILNQLNKIFKEMNKENIIYKDIKPEKILINLKPINKTIISLSDYNSSKITNISKSIIGNNYSSTAPEILKSGEISLKSDIWSLGILIYYMLFKEYPYKGKTEFQIIKDIESNKKLKKTDDNDLNDLLQKMLKINENERLSWNEYFIHNFFQTKKENQIDFPFFNFKCKFHSNNELNFYCCDCKINLCENCLIEHKSHKLFSFNDIGLNESETIKMDNILQQIENNLIKLNKLKERIINLLNHIKLKKENSSIFNNDIHNNFKQYYIDCLNIINNRLKIDNINVINFNNYISLIYDVKEKGKKQILSCYEQYQKEYPGNLGKSNEKEIRECCELYLNENKIDFDFEYKFQNEGKYLLKLKCKKKLTNLSCLFSSCYLLSSLDLSNFNSYYVTNLSYMFCHCSSLTSLDLSYLNTNNVIDMKDLFLGCFNLKFIDLTNFNTSKVTTMRYMFTSCSSLTSLNLSHFITDNVTDMCYMFYDCSSLTSLNLSNFNTNHINNMSYMFSGLN